MRFSVARSNGAIANINEIGWIHANNESFTADDKELLKAEYTFTEDIPHGTRSEVIDRKAMMKCHKLIEDKNSTEYMSLMFNRPDFFKINKFQVTSEKLKRPDVSLTVDTEQDYEIVNKILKYFKNVRKDFMRFVLGAILLSIRKTKDLLRCL